MNERHAAEENLRVIRSLMERATVYRAISAPTALVGGVLSLATSALLLLKRGDGNLPILDLSNPGAARRFIAVWCIVLVATLAANTFFIWRKAQREKSRFFTSGLKLAISSAAPVLLVTGVLSALFWRTNETAEALPIVTMVWITCYGLALLSTSSFAPLSLRLVGWAFLLTGVIGTLLLGRLFTADPARGAVVAMALTFGVYNLVYAVATWPRKRDGA